MYIWFWHQFSSIIIIKTIKRYKGFFKKIWNIYKICIKFIKYFWTIQNLKHIRHLLHLNVTEDKLNQWTNLKCILEIIASASMKNYWYSCFWKITREKILVYKPQESKFRYADSSSIVNNDLENIIPCSFGSCLCAGKINHLSLLITM